MMGKFINTEYKNTIDNIIESMKKMINNPYYKWNDHPPTKVTYYHINKDRSTLDPGSKLTYEEIGNHSSLIYDRIDEFYLYGIEQITTNIAMSDFGIQSDTIEGEAIILPGTIEPYTVDYFSIDYIKESILFRVNNISFDTLDNGANIYKIAYKLKTSREETAKKINNQLGDIYKTIMDNNGTGYHVVVKNQVFEFVKVLDDTLVKMKRYYKELFYSTRVQTFIFKFLEDRFYDPYMIEFLSKNQLLEGDGEYIYIHHKTKVPHTFSIKYDRTFFACIENKDISNIRKYKYKAGANYIDDFMSIFHTRVENYFSVEYDAYVEEDYKVIMCFKDELIDNIENHEYFDNEFSFYNIIIKYFYNEDITQDDLDILKDLDYNDNTTLYYYIPVLIYCLESFVKDRLKKKDIK